MKDIQTTIDAEKITISEALVSKYSKAGPRYTSYPTAPNWDDTFGPDDFVRQIEKGNEKKTPLSLYFHIPFCEERCTFCACNVVATKRHEVSEPYLEALIHEIKTVAQKTDGSREVSQLHWGGGTPTYLNPKQIEKLYNIILQNFVFEKDAEISVEIDPRITTEEQLKVLRQLGFNRVSLGVQDFEPEVQKLAGRIQPEKQTRHAVEVCRELKFKSINMDLIYGLPKQTLQTFQSTIQKVLVLDPDRIALFNFAYVPWMHAHQRKIFDQDLATPIQKLKMFCEAVQSFQNNGYEFIGLDHFAKKNDELSVAKLHCTMYRNFQGYTTKSFCDMIGMGVTSISHLSGAFAQNAKKLKDYENLALSQGLATQRGMFLNADDLKREWVIRELMCHQCVDKKAFEKTFDIPFDVYFKKELEKLPPLEKDQLICLNSEKIRVTPLGRIFLRNIAMLFDAYLQPQQKQFSKTL
ncbi:MAG: oxygen-independent coproporphyrinogen III oxidase [Deltaproteobacteria bacterium]|nr:oxygen-independent coproporphyrinogen III oxidase [Deltaproteobacteria bacterium]